MSALQLVNKLKRCCVCEEHKPLNEFSVNNSAKDKLQYRCKACDIAYQTKRREADREKFAEYSRQYQRARRQNFDYRLQMLVNASKQRAKLKNIEHSITASDLKAIYPIDGRCPIFGVKLEFNSAGFRDNSPSVDRIDPNKGYTLDNIQVISWKANRIKGAASLSELEMLVAYMKQGG